MSGIFPERSICGLARKINHFLQLGRDSLEVFGSVLVRQGMADIPKKTAGDRAFVTQQQEHGGRHLRSRLRYEFQDADEPST